MEVALDFITVLPGKKIELALNELNLVCKNDKM